MVPSLLLPLMLAWPAQDPDAPPPPPASPWGTFDDLDEYDDRPKRREPPAHKPRPDVDDGEGEPLPWKALGVGAGVTAGVDAAAVTLLSLLRVPLGCCPGVGLVGSLAVSGVLCGEGCAAPLVGWAALGKLGQRRTAMAPTAGIGAGLNGSLKLVGGVLGVAGTVLHNAVVTVILGIATFVTTAVVFALLVPAAASRGDDGEDWRFLPLYFALVAGVAGMYLAVPFLVLTVAGFLLQGLGVAAYAVGGGAGALAVGVAALLGGRALAPGEPALNLDTTEVPPPPGARPPPVRGRPGAKDHDDDDEYDDESDLETHEPPAPVTPGPGLVIPS